MLVLKEDAEKWAREEIQKTNYPSILNFETSLHKGQELAERYGANKDLVYIGCCLMDIKLGEAFQQNTVQKHVKMGLEATRTFLEKYDISEAQKTIILESVANHHGQEEFTSMEAEVCANADCYRFIKSENVFAFVSSLQSNDQGFIEAIKFANEKLQEKNHILSLKASQEELEKEYQHFTS